MQSVLNIRKKGKSFLIVVCIIIIGECLFLTRFNPDIGNWEKKEIQRVPVHELNFQEYLAVRDQYRDVLKNENPGIALEELHEQSKTDGSLMRSCHALAHDLGREAYGKYKDFGEALYYQKEICNSGYLHGVIEAHFLKSTDIFRDMNTICENYMMGRYKSWECYHGVGHGFMYYTLNNLPKSISLCELYKEDFAKNACINGVFMENFNTDQKLHPSTFLKNEDPFYPCYEQHQGNKEVCYFYAPTFYLSLHKNDYASALKWCVEADLQFQSACISGVGSEAVKENIHNPALIEKICTQTDKNKTTSCITGMIQQYLFHFSSVNAVKEICASLKDSNKSLCQSIVTSYSEFFKN